MSMNGSANAILWTVDNGGLQNGTPAVLHAYDPANLADEYYNSTQAANNRDQGPPATTFTSAVVANGHVYVAGVKSVAVYGLLSQ
jgi:hypothetical protein